MKYIDLLEFCELLLATDADISIMADKHVQPNGYIAQAWGEILDAIHKEEDFDFRAFFYKALETHDKKERLN